MNDIKKEKSALFEEISNNLSLSFNQMCRAEELSSNLIKWLSKDDFNGNLQIKAFTQGSYRLGTMIKPLSFYESPEYDVDLVAEACNYNKSNINPKELKFGIKDIIIENEIYKQKLIKKESRLCWKLQYSPEESTINQDTNFHIDVLPAVYDTDSSIHHPYKIADNDYEWKSSDPEAFAKWFEEIDSFFVNPENKKNRSEYLLKKMQENKIRNDSINLLLSKNENGLYMLPHSFSSSPLQNAIKLLKRTRDIYCDENKNKKITSIVITVISAFLYNGEVTAYEAFKNILNKLANYKKLFINSEFSLKNSLSFDSALKFDIIKRIYSKSDKCYIWQILNPCNSEENYASTWHLDNNKGAKDFFDWVESVENVINQLEHDFSIDNINTSLKKLFGENVSKYIFNLFGKSLNLLRENNLLNFEKGSGLLTVEKKETTKLVKDHHFYGASDSKLFKPMYNHNPKNIKKIQQLNGLNITIQQANKDNSFEWKGAIKPTSISNTYKITFRKGSFFVEGVTENDFLKIPHIYQDGSLCLYYNDCNEKEFDINHHSYVSIIPWVSEWLLYYEIWKITNKWVGKEIVHGGGVEK